MDGDFEEIPGFRTGPVEGPVAGLDQVAASVGGGRVRSADSGEVDFRNLFAGVDTEVDLPFLALAAAFLCLLRLGLWGTALCAGIGSLRGGCGNAENGSTKYAGQELLTVPAPD